MVKPMYQSLGQELEEASEGERLVFPFVGQMYDVSNAALFYAHNGRLDTAQEKLAGECFFFVLDGKVHCSRCREFS